MRDSSSSICGKRSRNIGASHQLVVARWPSSSAVPASKKVPVQAAQTMVPPPETSLSQAVASTTSGFSNANARAGGILAPSAGTTMTSGRTAALTGTTGTIKPLAVRIRRRNPTSETSNWGTDKPTEGASSLAMPRVSIKVDTPVSNMLSVARIWIFMARMVSIMPFLPLSANPCIRRRCTLRTLLSADAFENQNRKKTEGRNQRPLQCKQSKPLVHGLAGTRVNRKRYRCCKQEQQDDPAEQKHAPYQARASWAKPPGAFFSSSKATIS